jgi:hypothetical protein
MAHSEPRRATAAGLACASLLAAGWASAAEPAGAVALGRHVSDAKYAISFNLPTSWRGAVVSTTNSALTKLQVFARHVDNSDGLIRVDVVAGRQLSTASLALALGATSGVKVIGSKVVKAAVGDVEQLTFTATESDVLVYGTIDGFYRAGHTYYVSFESPLRAISNAAITVVMGTWGR